MRPISRDQIIILASAAVALAAVAILIGVLIGRGGDGGSAGLSEAAEDAAPAVVMLSLGGGAPNTPDAAAPVQLGSGFLVSADGLIVTTTSVVGTLPVARAIFADGIARQAEVIGRDGGTGIALLKVAGEAPFKFRTFSDDAPRIGQGVLLMGAPFGLGGTASGGIVAHAERKLDPSAPYGLIQTDATLTGGGTGGPLLEADGEVLGVADAGFSSDPGIAFAVPASVVKAAVERMRPKD
jgi:serine protease Do